jgi:uncharacterized membrane protein
MRSRSRSATTGMAASPVMEDGRRSTTGQPLFEVYLFDFKGDLYGKTLRVHVVSYLRGEAKFDSADALITQMDRDSEEARAALASLQPSVRDRSETPGLRIVRQRSPAIDVSENPLQAILLMSGAMLIVPVMDIIAKYLSSSIHPLEVTFGRFVFQFLVSLVFALILLRLPRPGGQQPFVNFLRGILLASASLCFFIAVKYMSVATAISIFFVEPMILTILAALILKEPVGPRRIGAIAVGLAGALIILRPNLAEIGLVSLLPVATAVLFSFYLLAQPALPRSR